MREAVEEPAGPVALGVGREQAPERRAVTRHEQVRQLVEHHVVQHGFVVHHVEGAGNPSLNGAPIGTDPVPLKNGDLIELAGTQMQFVQV